MINDEVKRAVNGKQICIKSIGGHGAHVIIESKYRYAKGRQRMQALVAIAQGMCALHKCCGWLSCWPVQLYLRTSSGFRLVPDDKKYERLRSGG